MRGVGAFLAYTILGASGAQAGLSSISGLTSVNAYEGTYVVPPPATSFAPGDLVLTAKLDPLTQANRDLGHYLGEENYDIFYSDAFGNLDANGFFLTIEGNCDVAANCFNISAVTLTVNGTEVFADQLLRAVYGRPGSAITPGSAANAVDGNLSTFTEFGDTIGLGSSARMAITVGFSGYPAAVPEPASWALMIGGFALAGGALRFRRYRQAIA
jgi:hypothetical protein